MHNVIRDQSQQNSSIFLLEIIQRNLHFKCPSVAPLIGEIITLDPGGGEGSEASLHLSNGIMEIRKAS